MVTLSRIYTRTGDDGSTALGDGSRVHKTHPRIAAYGGVDELNSVLGVVLTGPRPEGLVERLRAVQNDLFDVGADLCLPERNDPERKPGAQLRVTDRQIERLEQWIDDANSRLAPLKSFVLPGGTPAAAQLHHARAVCRRTEIGVLKLAESEPVNRCVAVYLNRLSDLLFVWARVCNSDGRDDILWQPGQGTTG